MEGFEYKGKRFGGFAKLRSDVDNENQGKIDEYIWELRLVEVGKNSKVSKDEKDEVSKVIDYKDRDCGKEEKEKEDDWLENL